MQIIKQLLKMVLVVNKRKKLLAEKLFFYEDNEKYGKFTRSEMKFQKKRSKKFS